MTEQMPLFKSKFREQYPEFEAWSLEELLTCWKTRFGKEPVTCIATHEMLQDKIKMSYSTEAAAKVEPLWIDMSFYLFEHKLLSIDSLPDISTQAIKYSFHADH